ncbi:MAG: 4a-hydroxytetrahydrobiopterin dehydratase [Elusimicrobia bacterium]|nr:4a-hydroxytetrahydrobiopterin dehydratase [Elusimicrobiota bacterium]
MAVRQLSTLAEKECVPCRAGAEPLRGGELRRLLSELGGGWQAADGKRLRKDFEFKDFQAALDFADTVGRLAQRFNHHPEIRIGWGYARVTIWTHKIGGLSEADFVLAAKIDAL